MDKETLDKINKFTRRPLREEEIYAFPVTLCDNDIDRDNERFSDEALLTLSKLFVGKTGIFDHNPTGDNQTARIYDAEVVIEPGKLTKDNRIYKYLRAEAYMVRTDKNADLIAEIDAGIKKEVSVSCSASKNICSVCGCDRRITQCEHHKGQDGCHVILDDITDAYEWSFVAVPAQINAGVTKKYSPTKEEKSMGTEFTPITTKAEFDAAVKNSVDAAVAQAEKKFEGWKSPEDFAALTKERDDLTAKNKAYEIAALRVKAATEKGLPLELADRLKGETEEELLKDAEALAGITAKSAHTPRHFTPDNGSTMDGIEREFYAKNPDLKNN